MKKMYVLNDPEMAKILAVTDDISKANLVRIVNRELSYITDVICHFDNDKIDQINIIQQGNITFKFRVREVPFYQQDMTREEVIKKAAECHLEREVTFCIDKLGWKPSVALREWDL